MSSLSQKIDADFISAYKGKEELATSCLRLLKSAIKNAEIAKKSPLTDEEVLRLIQKEIKQRKESIEQYTSGGRLDLADKDNAEIELLSKYMPEQLTEDQVKQIAEQVISELSASGKKDFGRVMGTLMPKIAGKADGSTVSRILNSLLLDD